MAFARAQERISKIIDVDLQNNKNFQPFLLASIASQGLDPVREASRLAVCNGKRLRSSIIGTISRFQNRNFLMFIEYVHAASLVIDDLPCMDNDEIRRGQETVHKKFGEYIAQLVAYNLMITALKHFSDGLQLAIDSYSEEHRRVLYTRINTEVNENLGHHGIGGGQYLDLVMCRKEIQTCPPREQRELILKLIKLKTGCLFGISFLLGWIARGGDIAAIDDIREAGYNFGICYQIIDDIRDVDRDREKNGGVNNICRYYTRNEIIDLFTEKISQLGLVIEKYNLWSPIMKELYDYLLDSFREALACPVSPISP
jgi:geranylgeranyl pyrophosphate synthase